MMKMSKVAIILKNNFLLAWKISLIKWSSNTIIFVEIAN